MMQQSSDVHASQHDRLATIWAIVEARKTFPSMILVASATDADDTTTIARGLADVTRDAGQRTGYLRLNAGGRPSLAPIAYTDLAIVPRGSEREAFDAALASWRASYDVIIIDVSNVSSVGLAAHAARVADGVVLAVCAKRRVVAADRELATLLAELQASVIGVVMSASAPKIAPVRAPRDRPRLQPAAQP